MAQSRPRVRSARAGIHLDHYLGILRAARLPGASVELTVNLGVRL